jgi:hypothetical protein
MFLVFPHPETKIWKTMSDGVRDGVNEEVMVWVDEKVSE